MNRLAADYTQNVAHPLSHLDDLATGFHPNLGNDTQDIPFPRRRGGANDEVGAAEEEEVQYVVFRLEGVIHQLPYLLRR